MNLGRGINAAMFTWEEEVKEASSRQLPHRQTPLWRLYVTALPHNVETHKIRLGQSAWLAPRVKMSSVRLHVMSMKFTVDCRQWSHCIVLKSKG